MKRSDRKRKRRVAALPQAELRLPKALYTEGWSRLVQMIKVEEALPKSNVDEARLVMGAEGLRTAEALLVSPSVCLQVVGENAVLCRLLDLFGVKGVEQLLEERAIQFLLWRPAFAHWPAGRDNPADPDREPLFATNITNSPYNDPQASVELGLKKWSHLPLSQLGRVAKLAMDLTHLPATTVPHDAKSAVEAAYDAGALRAYGLSGDKPRRDLDDEQRGVLTELATDAAAGLVLYDLEFDLHESDTAWEQLLRFGNVARAPGVAAAVNEGLELESLPNIQALVLDGAIKLGDIVALRNHAATEEFRKWLWSQPDPRSAKDVARAWLSQITTTPLKERTWFKAVRLTGFSLLGGLAGALTASAQGVVLGTAAGAGLNEVLGALDTFGLDKLLARPGPRRFAELLRTKRAEHAPPAQRAATGKESM